MVKVRGMNSKVAVNFSMEVAATQKDALTTLPALDRSLKLEVVVIFSYNIQGESLYVWQGDVSVVNARILREEENQDEVINDLPRRVLLAPTIFVCDSVGIVKVQHLRQTHKAGFGPLTERCTCRAQSGTSGSQ